LVPDASVQLPSAPFDLDSYIDKIISAAIKMHSGNKSAAAAYLGLSRRSLAYRAERLTSDQ
jgi:DNA-binding NtrC family response regulator